MIQGGCLGRGVEVNFRAKAERVISRTRCLHIEEALLALPPFHFLPPLFFQFPSAAFPLRATLLFIYLLCLFLAAIYFFYVP